MIIFEWKTSDHDAPPKKTDLICFMSNDRYRIAYNVSDPIRGLYGIIGSNYIDTSHIVRWAEIPERPEQKKERIKKEDITKDKIFYVIETIQMAQCTASEHDNSDESIRSMHSSMIIFIVNNGDGRHKKTLSIYQKPKR